MSEISNSGTYAGDLRFFRNVVTGMAAVLVSGFVFQLAMGRSSFGAPMVVHAHAVVFMGWAGITVTQAWLADAGVRHLHRLLGNLAIIWIMAMLVLGPLVTVEAARTGRVPFFFQPQHFVLADPGILLGFFLLFSAAIFLRHRHDWHPRLQIGAFMMLMGPGIGRMLPMPLLPPYAFEAATLVPLAVPVICMVRDLRVHGRIHPAWWWSIGVLLGTLIVVRVVAFSPTGAAIYGAAVEGSAAAGSDGLAYPPPPPQ